MIPECGNTLCGTNAMCIYGCLCFMNGATLSVVAFNYQDWCGGATPNYLNGSTVSVSNLILTNRGALSVGNNPNCAMAASPPPIPPAYYENGCADASVAVNTTLPSPLYGTFWVYSTASHLCRPSGFSGGCLCTVVNNVVISIAFTLFYTPCTDSPLQIGNGTWVELSG